jgi:cytochrome c
MRNHLAVAIVLAGCVSCTPPESAPPSGRGTPAEASALLELAAAHYEQVGRTQALADFTAQEAPFVDRDLYVFCYGPDRTITGHGGDPALVGVDYDGLRDIDGKAFGTEIWDTGSQPGGGTVAYKWMNSVSGQVEPKVSVVRKLGEDVCGVGAYNP